MSGAVPVPRRLSVAQAHRIRVQQRRPAFPIQTLPFPRRPPWPRHLRGLNAWLLVVFACEYLCGGMFGMKSGKKFFWDFSADCGAV